MKGAPALHDFRDFTEAHYRSLLRAAATRFRFERFGTLTSKPHLLWRHDVDLSVHRACRMAEMEREEGVRSTFFLLLHSEFYNILEREVASRVRRIAALGHHIGLHFDPSFYGTRVRRDQLTSRLAFEKRIIEDIVDAPVRVFSLHDPTSAALRTLAADMLSGMINAYGPAIRNGYRYCSDSNGYWRHQHLADVLADPGCHKLHVLTHPEWWTPRPMSPWRRMKRCVEGRAAFMLQNYDAELKRDGRLNLGRVR
jgi:hypothetical protein